jgi:hypothetical protein
VVATGIDDDGFSGDGVADDGAVALEGADREGFADEVGLLGHLGMLENREMGNFGTKHLQPFMPPCLASNLPKHPELLRPRHRLSTPLNSQLAIDMTGMGFHGMQRDK